MKKRAVVAFLFIIILVFIFLAIFLIFTFDYGDLTCGDGTLNGECSVNNPYFCQKGTLIEKASLCGCPEILNKQGEFCVSDYQTNQKNIFLNYVINGKEKQISLTVYQGMENYLSNVSKLVKKNGNFSRQEFVLKNINEPEQRELLLPLVIKIQNLEKNKIDQARAAISLVQNIPFAASNKTITLGPNLIADYSRYAYEVVYEKEGVCGEKSGLLLFLLKEIGYESVLFYYQQENHESVGTKCPREYSLGGKGYCFIETSGPSIISNNEILYTGGTKLVSEPEIIFISEGESFPENLYEYEDAEVLTEINNKIGENQELNRIDIYKLNKLKKKYGLCEIYYI